MKPNTLPTPTGVAVDAAVKPIWNFVITLDGEIVIGAEDYEAIKHTCLAGGLAVCAAGQIGIEQGARQKELRVIDLQSGHYVRPNVAPSSASANQLVAFTGDVFRAYDAHFGLGCLHANFNCIW